MWAISDIEPLMRLLTQRSSDRYSFSILAVVYLVGVFVALLFRPERITRRWLFRLSLAFFALFLLIPSVADLEILTSEPSALERGIRSRMAVDMLAQLMLTAAILLGVCSFGRVRP